jgi:hypothetical protein
MGIPSSPPRRYTTSRQLIAGDDFNNLSDQLNSFQAVTALGVDQNSAAAINAANVEILAGSAAATGVRLPVSYPGLIINLLNNSANTENIFPLGNDQIQTGNAPITYGAAGAAVTAATLTSYSFICMKKGFWQRALWPGVA